MDLSDGYMIDLSDATALTRFVDSFRTESMRIFSGLYARAVADEAARRIDLHRSDLHPRNAEDCPLREATETLRRLYADGQPPASLFDCDLRLHPTSLGTVAVFERGEDNYTSSLSGIAGAKLVGENFSDEQIDLLSNEIKAREPFGIGLTFKLLEKGLPTLRWSTVRNRIPDHDTRIRRTARARAFFVRTGKSAPNSAAEMADFRRWLTTPEGEASYEAMRRFVAPRLPKEIGGPELATYGHTTPTVQWTEQPHAQPASTIDHADVIEASDGRIFIAVMDAGLAAEARVSIRIAGQQLSFTQSGVHFGCVEDVPNNVLDLLKDAKNAIVVEIRQIADKKEIKAKHVAIISDITDSESFRAANVRWRRAAARTKKEAETW